eukprot:COSAG06_NODE_13243_length_1278_cov_56.287532_1_plen_63_part_10
MPSVKGALCRLPWPLSGRGRHLRDAAPLGPRLKCIVEEDVMYDVHSHSSSTGNGGGGAESGHH